MSNNKHGASQRKRQSGKDRRASGHRQRQMQNVEAKMASAQLATAAKPQVSKTGKNANTANPQLRTQTKQSFGSAKKLKIIPLGGLGEVGRNMNIIEYGNDAIVLDAGLRLGIDLPGINYAIPDFSYLESIKSKIRGHVFTHGHLDHVGAMPFIYKDYPLPVYGSRFTLDMLERIMLDRDPDSKLQKRYLNPDNHDKVVIGPFKIELVRVTHSIPDATAVVIDTPEGRIVHTGDFRLDPTPLDGKPSDLDRLGQIGKEGVALLMSDSTNCENIGHTETERVIEPAIDQLIKNAPGRVIISAVSTNINRIQMIINAATKEGRRVAIDGRSMLANVELAVRNGYIKIPRGTIVAMRDIGSVSEQKLAIVSTGHQGELGSVLMRMASGEHRFVKLKPSDTVILSASPIPGNEKSVVEVVDRLMREGAVVFQHSTRDINGTGPLHVSGHGNRDELTKMMELTKPKHFMPIHGEYHHQLHHAQLARENGISKDNIFVLNNGNVLEISNAQAKLTERVPAGTQLIDQTGALVPNLVIKDRLLMSEDGIVVVVLTINKSNGVSLSSPDIITRGFIYIKENEELMRGLRNKLKQFAQRRFKRMDINKFKLELRDEVSGFLFSQTNRSPMVIPVVNLVGGNSPRTSK